MYDKRKSLNYHISRASKSTTAGKVTIEFKVPGIYGSTRDILLGEISLCFSGGVAGDYLEEVNIIDKDNKTGSGINSIYYSWKGDTVVNYQSGGLWIYPGDNIISSMGDFPRVPAELYIQIKATKSSGDAILYVNAVWSTHKV